MYLVSHADGALGGRVAAKLLCSGARVRVIAPQQPLHLWRRRQLSKLRTSGAEVVRGGEVGEDTHTGAADNDTYRADSLSKGSLAERAWRGVDTAVYLPATSVRCGKEVVASVGDVGTLAFVQAAAAAGVRRVVLLDATLYERAALRRLREVQLTAQQGALELVLLEPALPPEHALEIALAHGSRARLAERRRLLVFWPLQGLADAAARAADSLTPRVSSILLPAVVRRYSDVLETVETLLASARRGSLSHGDAHPEDVLWSEVVFGSPLKAVTAGVAGSLGLELPPAARYLEAVSGMVS